MAEHSGFEEIFIEGSGNRVEIWDRRNPTTETPVIIRGLKHRKALKYCKEKGIDFYYMDTGYFGNWKHKTYHRITRNNLQYIGPIIDRPPDRLNATGIKPEPMSDGSDILLVLPSNKVMTFFNIDLDNWIRQTTKELKKYTDRKIITRLKPPRRKRIRDNSLAEALRKDIYCVVTFNSIAAVEALMSGKPAITLGPNAAQQLCSEKISEIESIKRPSIDKVYSFLKHLSYQQFTWEEMQNGFAWKTLNEE